MTMRNVLFLFLISISFLGTVSAQSTDNDSLQPTKLGKWKKPAPTKIAEVDAYIVQVLIRKRWIFVNSTPA